MKHFKNDFERLCFYIEVQRGNEKDPEGKEPDYKKVCDVNFGDWVQIVWQNELEGTIDDGYIMGFPPYADEDANLEGIVHIPRPQNPGGKGDVPGVWVTLHELRINSDVRCVQQRKQNASPDLSSEKLDALFDCKHHHRYFVQSASGGPPPRSHQVIICKDCGEFRVHTSVCLDAPGYAHETVTFRIWDGDILYRLVELLPMEEEQ